MGLPRAEGSVCSVPQKIVRHPLGACAPKNTQKALKCLLDLYIFAILVHGGWLVLRQLLAWPDAVNWTAFLFQAWQLTAGCVFSVLHYQSKIWIYRNNPVLTPRAKVDSDMKSHPKAEKVTSVTASVRLAGPGRRAIFP
jgi:hypothetical protein